MAAKRRTWTFEHPAASVGGERDEEGEKGKNTAPTAYGSVRSAIPRCQEWDVDLHSISTSLIAGKKGGQISLPRGHEPDSPPKGGYGYPKHPPALHPKWEMLLLVVWRYKAAS